MSRKLTQPQHELARAEKALSAAETLFDRELFEDSVSRAYYCVFHSARAALATREIFPTTHDGVKRMFGLHLVKPGLLDEQLAEILTAEQEDRELSDYDVRFEMEKDRAERRLDQARQFLAAVKAHVADTTETRDANPD